MNPRKVGSSLNQNLPPPSAGSSLLVRGRDSRPTSRASAGGGPRPHNGRHPGPPQPGQQQHRRNRAGRVRTVLTEKQLNLLKTCYHANPRPDALMKEQLVEMTGLSPRVVRVWFQNKRCKDKKKMALKQVRKGELC